MGNIDRFYDLPSEHPFRANPIEPSEGVLRFPSTPPSTATRVCGAALELVYQAAEVIKGIETHANDAEQYARGVADNAVQKLQIACKRVEELETELQSAQACISEVRVNIKESDEAAKVAKSRLEAAEAKMCQLEMRARTAETQARENASAVARIEEAIRTQILAKRQPLRKPTPAG